MQALDARQIAEWKAFDLIDPIGGYRGDANAAMVAYTVARSQSGKKSGLKVTDFLPKWGPQILPPLPPKKDLAKKIHGIFAAISKC